MPTITINARECEFEPGQTILQVANAHGVKIPYYCYHDALSVPAQCRICLAEIWAPNPRNEGRLEPFMGGKLMPTCSTVATDGMVVRSDSPKSVANQKAVMEYLLINHPLDCPVCDQAGECELQDYSYRYGRGASRFEEVKVKQPKKNLGPHVWLYADRCIMCTRCVRFTQEVPGTGEIGIISRGNKAEIDVFDGAPLVNELSANVIDLCPVGALLDKDFLFTQRVWFLKRTPSIDPITASGDNIWIEHNEGRIYRLKPRENKVINRWWMTDEVRYGWKFVHSDRRLTTPMRRVHGALSESDRPRAYEAAIAGIRGAGDAGKRLALVLSPMLACEEAYALATLARELDQHAIIGLGPVPTSGEDRAYPPDKKPGDEGAYVVRAEKAPNARGIRRVIEGVTGSPATAYNDLLPRLRDAGAVILTGNYPSEWATDELLGAISDAFVVVIDTLRGSHTDAGDVVLPSVTWAEKGGTFENADGVLQSFERAIPPLGGAKSEGQLALELAAAARGEPTRDEAAIEVVDEQPGRVPEATTLGVSTAGVFKPAEWRARMGETHESLRPLAETSPPETRVRLHPDMEVVEL